MLGLVIGGGTLLISVVLLLLLVGTVLKCRVHRKRKSLPDHDPSETRPLLTPGNSPHSECESYNVYTHVFYSIIHWVCIALRAHRNSSTHSSLSLSCNID